MKTILAALAVTLAAALATTTPLCAQPATGKAATQQVRLIMLGTRAGEFPAPYRAQTSYALVVGEDIYLIDAGDGALRRLGEAGLTIRNIAAIFITHLHDDHTTGLPALMSVEWQFHREKPVGIYGPPQTKGLVDAALAFSKFNADARISEGQMTRPIAEIFAGHDVPPGGEIFHDANIRVSAAENSHFSHFKPGSISYGKTKSYSYRVETPAGVIVFSGDTGPSPALNQLAKGADVFVSEIMDVDRLVALRKADGSWATFSPSQRDAFIAHAADEHSAPKVVADVARTGGVGTVILSHLPPVSDLKDDYRWAAAEVKQAGYAGPVLVSRDLSEYDLSPRPGKSAAIHETDALRSTWLGK
jgi:ribonuclease BN (tRNA processing enzyme)